jgi:hydrogenase expression/formation protein HypC
MPDVCLAIPSQIVKIADGIATINVGGFQATASLLLLEDVKVGDYVIVHAGFAIHKIDEKEARESLKILKEAAALVDQREPDG